MRPSGHIFYQDSYLQLYNVQWETIGEVIDLTSIIQQPFIWGRKAEGYIDHGILYRRGLVTIHRQVLRPFVGGYEIVAEGHSQYEDYIRMNFPCETGPTDPFRFHLDHMMANACELRVNSGPHWADPATDHGVVWSDPSTDHQSVTDGADVLIWIDVWS